MTPAAARRRSVVIAGHTGEDGVARLALHDPDPEVRAAALGALARLDQLDATTLSGALADPDPGVRRRAAAEAAGRADVSTSIVLDDPDPAVVEMAAYASGERDPAEAGVVTRLAALVSGHPDALVREAAVAALGAIGDPAGLDAILAATGDKPAIRRRAVIALAPFDGPAVDAALARAKEDRDWQVRQAAEDLLAP